MSELNDLVPPRFPALSTGYAAVAVCGDAIVPVILKVRKFAPAEFAGFYIEASSTNDLDNDLACDGVASHLGLLAIDCAGCTRQRRYR